MAEKRHPDRHQIFAVAPDLKNAVTADILSSTSHDAAFGNRKEYQVLLLWNGAPLKLLRQGDNAPAALTLQEADIASLPFPLQPEGAGWRVQFTSHYFHHAGSVATHYTLRIDPGTAIALVDSDNKVDVD